jgi:hypothetical protein
MASDTTASGRTYSRSSYAPYWVLLMIGCAVAGYKLGVYCDNQEWSNEYKDKLALAAIRSPSIALNLAEEAVEKDRLEFPVYRDLLGGVISREGGEARMAALGSIANVLGFGGAFAGDLKRWFDSQPPQVFIYSGSDGDGIARKALAEDLRQHSMDVVSDGTIEPTRSGKTEIRCYDDAVCKQGALSAANVLRGQGYEIDGPKKIDEGFELAAASVSDSDKSGNANDAMKLLNRKRVDIVLAAATAAPQSVDFDLGTAPGAQQALNKLGVPVKVDGDFGRDSRAALKVFQARNGLPQDGAFPLAQSTRETMTKALGQKS